MIEKLLIRIYIKTLKRIKNISFLINCAKMTILKDIFFLSYAHEIFFIYLYILFFILKRQEKIYTHTYINLVTNDIMLVSTILGINDIIF